MASNNFSIVDIEKDNDELQFQDFGLSSSSSRATNSQTHYFNDFPDSPGHQTDSQKKTCSPQPKRCRYDGHSSDEIMDYLSFDQPCSHSDLLTNSGRVCKDQDSTRETPAVDLPVKSGMTNCFMKTTPCAEQQNGNAHEKRNVEPLLPKRDKFLLCTKHTSVQAILPDDVKSAAELVPALVLRVCSKQFVSKAVKNLASCWPVAELHHLKRVNRIPEQLSTILDVETVVHQVMTCDKRNEQPKASQSVDEATVPDSKFTDALTKSKFDDKQTTSGSAADQDSACADNSSCTITFAKPNTAKNAVIGDAFFLYIDVMASVVVDGWSPDKIPVGVDGNHRCESGTKLSLENLDGRLPKPILNKELSRTIHEKLSKKGVDLSLFSSVLYVGRVSRCPPRLRHQFEAVTASWPCTFHEDENLTKLIEGNVFSEPEIQNIIAHMNHALMLTEETRNESTEVVSDELANETRTDSNGKVALQNDSSLCGSSVNLSASSPSNFGLTRVSASSNSLNVERSSCVMIENTSNRIVVQSVDKRGRHPLAHAAMVAVDRVAQTLGGGAWPSLHENNCSNFEPKGRTNPAPTETCEYKQSYSEKVASKCSSSAGPNTSTSPSSKFSSSLNENSSVSTSECLEKTSKEASSGSYICTGLDVYLSHEPCMMCAMALLHSRVSRVFYRHSNKTKGALGSVVKLHTLANINHRYQVFSVTSAECHCVSKEPDS